MRAALAKFVSHHPTLTLFILVAVVFAITFAFSKRFRTNVYETIDRIVRWIARLIAFVIKTVGVTGAVLLSVAVISGGIWLYEAIALTDAGGIIVCQDNACNSTTVNGPKPTQ